MKSRRNKLATILVGFLIALLSFSPTFAAASILPGLSLPTPVVKPFGGKIIKIRACASPPGFMLTIGPPVGGEFFLNPATSKIYAYGVIMPQVWTLGVANPIPMECSEGNPDSIGGFSVGFGKILDSAATKLATTFPILNAPFSAISDLATDIGGVFSGVTSGITNFFSGVTSGIGDALGIPSGNILPGVGAILDIASGNFIGAAINIGTMVGVINPAVGIGMAVLSLLGINFMKDPPNLGSAHEIFIIGTGLTP